MGASGFNLMRRPDINLPSFADREANAAGPRYNTNYLRPYKGYAQIQMGLSDANSSYNALQVFLSKRRGDLSFTLNYTLGRAYDNDVVLDDPTVALPVFAARVRDGVVEVARSFAGQTRVTPLTTHARDTAR